MAIEVEDSFCDGRNIARGNLYLDILNLTDDWLVLAAFDSMQWSYHT
jgi:hypothetical protein